MTTGIRLDKASDGVNHSAMFHPDFEALVHRIIQTVEKEKLTEMRKDFHTRLRITLTQPNDAELIQDLWDFFYDWCVFEQKLPDKIENLESAERDIWNHVRGSNQRGLYTVVRASEKELKVKELFLGKSFVVRKRGASDFIGIGRTDIVEGRLVEDGDPKNEVYSFVRRPSYHPHEVHAYIKQKVKQFKKAKDFSTYQSWLWLIVGMYLKHRIYSHMPIERIYDDNSRI